MNEPVVPLYIRVSTYCQLYSITHKTAYKWIDAGLLETLRVGRCIRVRNAPPSDRRPSVSGVAAGVGVRRAG